MTSSLLIEHAPTFVNAKVVVAASDEPTDIRDSALDRRPISSTRWRQLRGSKHRDERNSNDGCSALRELSHRNRFIPAVANYSFRPATNPRSRNPPVLTETRSPDRETGGIQFSWGHINRIRNLVVHVSRLITHDLLDLSPVVDRGRAFRASHRQRVSDSGRQ